MNKQKEQLTQEKNLIQKNSKQKNEDGFSSDQQLQQQIIYTMPEYIDDFVHNNHDENKLKNQNLSQVRDLVGKRYSLEPDMITGWAPKVALPKPIPLTFYNYQFDTMIESALKSHKLSTTQKQPSSISPSLSLSLSPPQSPQKPRLCYLGARYESTYYAWYDKDFQFPYQHLTPPKNITFTDRQFVGQHWNAQKPEILQFDSLFESGNLDCVCKVGQSQYDLFIRVDTNTQGHLQWYNFRVWNMEPGRVYKFNICNFQKGKSLYSRGMRPYCYSKKKYENQNIGWFQIQGQSKYRKKISKTQAALDFQSTEKYFQLTFQFSTQYPSDTLQFSYCIPYPYSTLKSYLKTLQQCTKSRNILSIKKLCSSLGGNVVDQLTITQNVDQQQKSFKNKIRLKKKVIFITGRCHPGQTNGSWMVEGLLDFLCGGSEMAGFMRQNVVFKVIPMLNPDGVIVGNYRTGLFGRDFNREFHSPDKDVFPEIYYLKEMFWDYKRIYHQHAFIYLDFHGHSVKRNVFAYGPQYAIIHKNYYESRMIPKLIAIKSDMFRYHSCIFKISQSKQSTGRAIFLKSHKIPFTFTIQASNGSYYSQEQMKSHDFNQHRWKQVGQKVMEGIHDYLKIIFQLEKIREQKLMARKQMLLRNRERDRVKVKRNNQKVGYLTSLGSRKYKTSAKQEMQMSQNLGMQNVGLFFGDMLDNLKQMQGNQKISQILQQIKNQQNPSNNQNNQNFKPLSQDEISQGKSDSQSSKDDLDQNFRKQLLAVIKSKKKNKNKIPKITALSNYHKSATQQNQANKIQKQDDDQGLEKQNAKKISKQALIKRTLWKKKSSVFSSVSPKKQQSIPVAAKIVNFNFSINPVEYQYKQAPEPAQNFPSSNAFNSTYYTSKSSSNCLHSKNQNKLINFNCSEAQNQRKFGSRGHEYSDTFKKTFMSVQKEILRRDSHKRYLVAMNYTSSQSRNKTNIIVDNVRGKRIGHSVPQKNEQQDQQALKSPQRTIHSMNNIQIKIPSKAPSPTRQYHPKLYKPNSNSNSNYSYSYNSNTSSNNYGYGYNNNPNYKTSKKYPQKQLIILQSCTAELSSLQAQQQQARQLTRAQLLTAFTEAEIEQGQQLCQMQQEQEQRKLIYRLGEEISDGEGFSYPLGEIKIQQLGLQYCESVSSQFPDNQAGRVTEVGNVGNTNSNINLQNLNSDSSTNRTSSNQPTNSPINKYINSKNNKKVVILNFEQKLELKDEPKKADRQKQREKDKCKQKEKDSQREKISQQFNYKNKYRLKERDSSRKREKNSIFS